MIKPLTISAAIRPPVRCASGFADPGGPAIPRLATSLNRSGRHAPQAHSDLHALRKTFGTALVLSSADPRIVIARRETTTVMALLREAAREVVRKRAALPAQSDAVRRVVWKMAPQMTARFKRAQPSSIR